MCVKHCDTQRVTEGRGFPQRRECRRVYVEKKTIFLLFFIEKNGYLFTSFHASATGPPVVEAFLFGQSFLDLVYICL